MNVVRELRSLKDFDAFSELEDSVYFDREVRWPTFRELNLSLLTGSSAFVRGREIQAFGSFRRGRVVARALAVTEPEYDKYWEERIGHVALFEALSDAAQEAQEVLEEACQWLKDRGAASARSGFSHFEMPYQTDSYGDLPPIAMRQNPCYYHGVLASAKFEVEKRWVGYRIAVDDSVKNELQRWLEHAAKQGVTIDSLRSRLYPECMDEFAKVLNETFSKHWGRTPLTIEEIAERMQIFSSFGALDASAIAYRDNVPIGVTFSVRHCTEMAVAQSRPIRDVERLNLGGEAGVLPEARGSGVARGLVAHAYTDFIDHGAQHLYYGPVLADNWSSRHIGEGLGGSLMGHYIVYKRRLDTLTPG